MNVSSLSPAVSRRLSRSNSTSSSVATVKNVPPKFGHRKSLSQARPTSSDSINEHFSTLDAAAAQSHVKAPADQSRSPNLNINRWSHSTSSSMGAIDSDFLRQVPGNAVPLRPSKAEVPAKSTVTLKSEYSSRQPGESSLLQPAPRMSPGHRRKTSRRNSPEATTIPLANQDQISYGSALVPTPGSDRSGHSDYFGTTLLDHARGSNKYGQPIEGMALQFTAGHRQRKADQNKVGNGLYQATNSSHISLQKMPSHTRRRNRSDNGSKDTAAGGSMSSVRSDRSKRGGHRSPTQKNMLSQALAKANQAVLLDNAQNIQGAVEAYVEACEILEQVMQRSSDTDDRKKLSAIRGTYSTRIAELYDLDTSFDHLRDKELPEAPVTTRYLDGQGRMSFDDPDDVQLQPHVFVRPDTYVQRPMQIPLRQESLLPQIFGGDEYIEQQPPPSRQRIQPLNTLNVPMDAKYMPPPLSPRRPLSPVQTENESTPVNTLRPEPVNNGNRLSSESISWLDTKDESHSSASSRLSSIDFGTRDDQLVSAIEAEFDAMNAAVEAAYDEELPSEATPRLSEATELLPEQDETDDDIRTLATQPSQESIGLDRRYDYLTREYLDDDAEEEEELLEMMMAEGYSLDQQSQNPGAMSSLPRQSDSSGFPARSPGRTWESSITGATNGTTLTTLAESPEMPQHEGPHEHKAIDEATLPAQDTDVLRRKQSSPLPPLPHAEEAAPKHVGLRDRRLSSASASQLKIETFARKTPVSHQSQPGPATKLDVPSSQPELARSGSNSNLNQLPLTPLASTHSADSTDSLGTHALTQLMSNSAVGEEGSMSGSQEDVGRMPPQIQKNTSSSNLRSRNLSLTTQDLSNDVPPTPESALFHTHSRNGTSLATPAAATGNSNILSSTAVGGTYIFDHIADSVPSSPRSPDSIRAEPMPLESCPGSFLLRPFWLMRCLYQTLSHPRGGYISTKLFIPRDIWRVKGVKIKAMEEKAAQCDTLTAALLKLAKVDTLDADAVWEELQSFENILDVARTNLQKKLGSDVGLTGSVVAMNKSPAGEDPEQNKAASSVKSFASSWGRKLRSKSSTTILTPIGAPRKGTDTSGDLLPSLPMTNSSAVATSRSYRAQRHPPPSPTGMPHIPQQHGIYMASLARLFDAVQVLDSIARQVEDPGLKATNQTQVGLELSIRGAAEFFSFYILRFVLVDVGMLIDKYLKRNGEWVMV